MNLPACPVSPKYLNPHQCMQAIAINAKANVVFMSELVPLKNGTKIPTLKLSSKLTTPNSLALISFAWAKSCSNQ